MVNFEVNHNLSIKFSEEYFLEYLQSIDLTKDLLDYGPSLVKYSKSILKKEKQYWDLGKNLLRGIRISKNNKNMSTS